ncbi:MAG: fatty acid desaturase [Galbitalea sp.]
MFSFLPVGMAFAFIGVQMAVFGVYMGASFAPNHKGMPQIPRDAKVDFLHRQVTTSRNVHGLGMTSFMGGLNYQIEHHLFSDHGEAAPAARERHRQGLLRGARHRLHERRASRFVRHRHRLLQPRGARRTRSVRVPGGRQLRSLGAVPTAVRVPAGVAPGALRR